MTRKIIIPVATAFYKWSHENLITKHKYVAEYTKNLHLILVTDQIHLNLNG